MTDQFQSRSDDADTVAVPRAFLRELFIEDWGLWHSSPQGHCKRCKATWINGGKEKHKDGCLLAAPRSERGELSLLHGVLNQARETLLVSIKGTPDELQRSLGKLNLACKAHYDWRTERVKAAQPNER